MALIKDFDDEDLRYKIFEYEGLDYFFRYYISPDKIKDPELGQLARDYRVAYAALELYLEDHLPKEEEGE